eukprot:SAG31_NODE_467_length_15267_cov_13.792919_11_plen_246_part_00
MSGRDIDTISARALRQQIAIVPQSPTLFVGTIRDNLVGGNTPAALVTDARESDAGEDQMLLETLRTCRLDVLADRGLDGKDNHENKNTVNDRSKDLVYVGVLHYLLVVASRRAEWAVRWATTALLCCAGISTQAEDPRSRYGIGPSQLSSHTKWCSDPAADASDEATADLDAASANALLQVVERSFKSTTVLSIAHRLNFIKDFDRILVLNTGGTINAFDTPANLLEQKGGYFSRQLGVENQQVL